MSTFLIISPDPETRDSLRLALELKGHRTECLIGVEKFPLRKFDLTVIEIPIWNREELNVARSMVKMVAADSKVVLILPRGHIKPPSKIKAIASFTKPIELLKLADDLIEIAGKNCLQSN